MSELQATNCGCDNSCNSGSNCCWIIILLLLFGCGNSCGIGFGGDNSCWIIIILLFFCGGWGC